MTLSLESVHPLIVHFPIALLITAVGLEAGAVCLRRPGLQRIALWNLWLGALGAATAVWTGLEASEAAKHSFEIHQVMELHRRLGITTLCLAGVTVLWRLWRRDRLSARERFVTWMMMAAMAVTLIAGAYQGGRLVFEYGVGVRPTSPVILHHHSP